MARRIFLKSFSLLLIFNLSALVHSSCVAQVAGFPYKHAVPEDSAFIISILNNAKDIAGTNRDSALALSNRGLRASLSSGFIPGEIAAYRNFVLLHRKSDIDLAISYLGKEIALVKKAGDRNQLIEAYVLLAKLYEESGNFDGILRLYRVIFPLFRDPGISPYMLPRLVNSVGYAYFQTGRYDSSLHYFGSALLLMGNMDSLNYKDVIFAKSAIGIIHARIASGQHALKYFREAYQLASAFSDTDAMVGQLSNIGVLYYDMQEYDKAKQYLYEALQMAKANKIKITPQIYGMLATVISYYNPDSISSALFWAKECYRLARESNRFDDMIQASYTMGIVYQSNGEYREAEKYLLEGLGLALKKGKIENITNAYLNLYKVNIGLKQYKTALEYQTRYYQIKDSITGLDNAERITHIEQQYKTTEKDRQLAEQKVLMQAQESKLREKNFWISSITITAALLSLLFFVVYRNNRNKQKTLLLFFRQQQEINLLKARAEAENEERKRIGKELHDGIVSQLLAIKLNVNAIQDKDYDPLDGYQLGHIARQLEEATGDLRSTAHNLMPETLLQQGLAKAVATLCDKISPNGGIEADFQVYGNIPELDNNVALSLYRIIQELIQNTMKHAQATLLLVQLSYREGILSITVEDNGIGLDEKSVGKNAETMGITNLKRRVSELNGTIDISSRPGKETTVYIEFEEKWLI